MLQFLKQSRITETPLSVEHVESLLNVLVLDGEIERVIQPPSRHCLYTLLSLFPRSPRTDRPSGIQRQSQTIQSQNRSDIPRVNGKNDSAGKAIIAKARTRNGKVAIPKGAMSLPRHGKRTTRRSARTTTLTAANQDENQKLPTTTKIRRGSGRRADPGQHRKNRKTVNNLRMDPSPLLLTLIQDLVDPLRANV